MEGKAGKSNTGMIVGISVAAVVVVVILIAASSSTPTQYPVGYNPNMYPTGTNPYMNNPNNFYGLQSDAAALYTAAGSVLNKTLDTFFSSKNDQNNG